MKKAIVFIIFLLPGIAYLFGQIAANKHLEKFGNESKKLF
jgi:hypothetical protein